MNKKPARFSPIRAAVSSIPVRSVRTGLVNLIPVLVIGAFALILKTFPIDWYQNAIATFAGGFLLDLFNTVFSATFGVLSVYMTFSISRSYMKLKADPDAVTGGAITASLISFFILAGVDLSSFSTDSTGPKSMFLAIITGLCASSLYVFADRFFRRRKRVVYTKGADINFNRMLSTIIPTTLVVIVFALINICAKRIFDVDSFRELIARAFNSLFSYGEVGFFKGFFFVLLSSVLWFFGIHGSDTLEGVMQTYFTPGLAANQAAVAAGGAPIQILTKEFFDCFVLMGGCGSTICLLIAILIFSRNRAKRGLGITAAFPMIFNINELMVFGLPIIFNPVMLIPFLTVPLACYAIAYAALSLGIVPLITSEVAWTTPIILGGLRATGSAAGAILQLVNVTVGVLIYMPFVRLLDRTTAREMSENHQAFNEFYKKNEASLATEKIVERVDMYGDFAKGLTADLKHSLKSNIVMAYQPQYSIDGECVGVEALLRWRHPDHGFLYPPVVIKLAEDGGFLAELEEAIVQRVVEDRPAVLEKFGYDVLISFNVTGTTIVTERFANFLKELSGEFGFAGMNFCVEITEQAVLSIDDEATMRAFSAIRGMGLTLAIDDFSMGQTSLHYLKDKTFDWIKLDGSLVSGLFTHENTKEIIASIVNLSSTLGINVVAEYVETETQRDALHAIGCDIYQGYLYSPAVFLDE